MNHTTEKRLSTVTLSVEAIDKIIQNLDSNKPHGHDSISIRILKICGDSIYEPLEIIFRQALLTGVFPSEWKKGNKGLNVFHCRKIMLYRCLQVEPKVELLT